MSREMWFEVGFFALAAGIATAFLTSMGVYLLQRRTRTEWRIDTEALVAIAITAAIAATSMVFLAFVVQQFTQEVGYRAPPPPPTGEPIGRYDSRPYGQLDDNNEF